ncbi:MAG: TRAM domain-containing protein [Anaerolineae bacterium]|nr:MAG: TRAM domain-containing protein [Anaerolineae bacterium]
MVILSIAGMYAGISIGQLVAEPELYAVVFALVGALTGLIVTPWLTVRPIRALRLRLAELSARKLVVGLLGLVSGLLISALVTFPLVQLPPPFKDFLPFIAAVFFGYLGVAVFVLRADDIVSVLTMIFSGRGGDVVSDGNEANPSPLRPILMDTSVIIDGRIADIAKTGFLFGELLIPRFVLNELQYVADSADSLRRQRGRRGLEVLGELQKLTNVPVRISDIDVNDVREVDSKLVVLARQLHCPILTNDYNLNRVAELQGVTVLNINDLANAVRVVLLPGETMDVQIIQAGKEPGQGVGYLDDGTMVVVEDGEPFIGLKTHVMVTKVLQTSAGRMIFARVTAKEHK